MLELISIGKNFAGKQVLQNIDLKIEKGDFISFLGVSGCGKTTLLRILGGLDKEYHGKVLFNGQELNNKDLKTFSFVSQDASLIPWLTVEQNINFFTQLINNPKKIEEIISSVGLNDCKNQLPHQISGGMKKRTAIARAIVSNPSALLLDEPFSNLDYFNRLKMNEIVKKICKKSTVILVTHDVDEALRLSNKIVLLKGQPAKINKILNIKPQLNNTCLEYEEIKNQIIKEFEQ